MEQFCVTALALLPVPQTSGNEAARPLQIERPVRSSRVVVKLDDEGNVVRTEASSKVQICTEDGLLLVYEEKQPPVPKVKKRGLKEEEVIAVDDVSWKKIDQNSDEQ